MAGLWLRGRFWPRLRSSIRFRAAASTRRPGLAGNPAAGLTAHGSWAAAVFSSLRRTSCWGAAAFLSLGFGALPRSLPLELFLTAVYGGWSVAWPAALRCERASARYWRRLCHWVLFLHGRCAGRNRCGALTCCGSRDFAYLCPIQPNTLVPMYDVEFLPNPSAADLDALTDLWETSVRATHDFLAPDEICFYRSLVRGGALSAVRLWVVRRPGGGFAAFAGVADGMLEMLFRRARPAGPGAGAVSRGTCRRPLRRAACRCQ